MDGGRDGVERKQSCSLMQSFSLTVVSRPVDVPLTPLQHARVSRVHAACFEVLDFSAVSRLQVSTSKSGTGRNPKV